MRNYYGMREIEDKGHKKSPDKTIWAVANL